MTESSRICVKNIGKSSKEAELRNLFAKCGEITDLKIMRRPDGTSRNFAFIGYRTPAQAQSAVKYFNNTFIGLSKLSVSIALKLGELDDKTKLRKQKKATVSDPSSTAANNKFNAKDIQEMNAPSKVSLIDDKQPISKKKEKFLELALGKSKDLVTAASGAEVTPIVMDVDEEDESHSSGSMEGRLESDKDSDDENEDDGFVELSALKPISDIDYLRSKIVKKDGHEIEKVSMLGKQMDVEDEEENGSDSDDKDYAASANSDDDSAVDLDDLVKDPNAARKKLQKQQQKKETKTLQQQQAVNNNEAVNDVNHEQGNDTKNDTINCTTTDSNKDAGPNSRLYVTNLPYNATEEEVRGHFVAALGNDENIVLEVHLPLSRDDKRGRGFGFVRLVSVAAAETALHALHGAAFQGRVLHISYASEQQQPSQQALTYIAGGEEGLGWSEFQKKKEEERRKLLATASNTDKNSWNASYVRSDAVLDTMAQRYQSSAGDLLDVAGQQGGDVAVRMALAETQVVMDNAAFLALHNISLDQSSSSNHNSSTNHSNNNVKRSDHMLLVKNLPADALSEELEAMFARYGALSTFSLAPNRTLAVAEFLEPSEARAAYKGLAYRRYRTVPLYLEWAPLSNTGNNSKSKTNNNVDSNLKETNDKGDKKDATEKASTLQLKKNNVESTATCSIFVKNLNFSTDETALRNHILRALPVGTTSSLRSVIIQKKQKRVDGPLLSLGYGFAEFSDRASAMAALGRLQGTVLDDHSLEAQLSAKKLTETNNSTVVTTTSSNRKPKTKLLVKNIAFQATKKEIRDLFSAHGVVTSVRLPKTMAAAGSNGSLRHRGFAFVDFATAQEAQNAKAALSHAHLYGRHLVIDFEEDRPENLEDYPQDEGSAAISAGNETATLLAGRKRALRDAQLLETSAKNNSKRRKNSNPSGDAMAVDAAENKQMRSLL